MDENSVSFLSNVLNSVVFCYTWFRKPNFCFQAMSKQYPDVCFFGGSMRRSQTLEILVKKNLHKALRSVQFLASFISFYFEILSYLA